MNREGQKIGELVILGEYTEDGKTIVTYSDSVCVSIYPLVGVAQSHIYEDMLDVYIFDTDELVRMPKSILLKVIQGD